MTLNSSSTEFQESLASCVSCYRWFCNSIQIANFLSQSLYSIPRFRRAELRLNLHFHLLLSGSYKYLHQDFAMKVVSRGSFIRWCCCGKKMAVYFKYFCAGNYRFSWEYLSSKGVSAHIALTFTLFHTRVRAMRSYISLVVNCAQMSSIAFAASQLNPLSIVFLFKLLFTPKVGIEACFCSIT